MIRIKHDDQDQDDMQQQRSGDSEYFENSSDLWCDLSSHSHAVILL